MKVSRSFIAGLACLLLPCAAWGQRRDVAASDDSARAVHLLNRATFGVRPQDIAEVLATGRDKWLDRQLHPERIRDTLSAALVARYPASAMSMEDLYRDYAPQKAAAPKRDTSMASMTPAARAKAKDGAGNPQRLVVDMTGAKLERAMMSDRQLEEVMTDFWFNHFNVFMQKGADRYLTGDYERNAIRPHVFGKFEDLLVATAQHPAMLFYLDNWQSVYVDSSARRRVALRGAANVAPKAQERGLNENYARELLELHTLGVDGGYTQKDVIEVARALTGWTFVQPRPGGAQAQARRGSSEVEFTFREQLHDKGEKTVLGHRLAKGRGDEDGRDVLHILATHPSTARFISAKLVEYFVTDRGSPALVERLAKTFERTGGDLREVTRVLFTDPEFYAQENRRAKFKTPFQLVASALRVTGAQVADTRGILAVLRTMGQLPYMSSAPTGYPASSEEWVNSGAMLARMNFGIDLAAGKIGGIRVPARPIAALLPGVETTELEKALIADTSAQNAGTSAVANPRARAMRTVGLILGSPEFQKH